MKFNRQLLIFLTILVIISIPLINAQLESDGGDIKIFNLELEKILNLVIGILAFILFFITFVAYRRDGRNRFLYISLAFLLFSIKGFLAGSELLFPEVEWFDPVNTILELVIIILFFFGVIKKGG